MLTKQEKTEIQKDIYEKIMAIGKSTDPVDGLISVNDLFDYLMGLYDKGYTRGYNNGLSQGQKILGKDLSKN